MPAYATVADFEAYVEGWVTDNPAVLERELERASRDVDVALGPGGRYTTGPYAGFKLDPTRLVVWAREALARATSAQALHRIRTAAPSTDAPEPRRKRVKGPDYEVEYVDGDLAGSGRYSPDLARELEPLGYLRQRTARARA